LLAPRIADHVAAFAKLYADKHLEFEIEVAVNIAVACEAQDLEEMLGNLLDNACKWGRQRVRIAAEGGQLKISIVIDDDGSNLTDAHATDVTRAGQRIDESAPGYGFGLPITRKLAELYGGSLILFTAPLRGLRAVLSLPAAI
jgi:signal transduction histidine kinase